MDSPSQLSTKPCRLLHCIYMYVYIYIYIYIYIREMDPPVN